MPSSSIVHAAVFAVGAAIGAGTAVAVTRRRQSQPVVSVVPSTPSSVVEVERMNHPGGLDSKAVFSNEVLKYGNPGMT